MSSLIAPLKRVAITGASGFIGRHLVSALRKGSVEVVPLVRRAPGTSSEVVVDLSEPDSLVEALLGSEVLFHCAGYAHAYKEVAGDWERLHRVTNCDYVLNAARAAARSGVRRFVFCSSVKAVGEPGERCVDESFGALPSGAYGSSKRAAEQGLARISAATGLEVVVLRLAMVYGPGSRGNFERMLRLVERGVFPPLPDTGNRRSIVFVSDVVDALILAAQHRDAVGRCYIVAHPAAPSGRHIYDVMRSICGKPPTRWQVPALALRSLGRAGDVLARVGGRRFPIDSQVVSRLLDSACYCPDAIRGELGWEPKVALPEGIQRVRAEWQSLPSI